MSESEIWTTVQRHLDSIFSGDVAAYEATTSEDLSLFEWWVTHNESRVLVKRDGQWQVVHVHKSPAWPAPSEPK